MSENVLKELLKNKKKSIKNILSNTTISIENVNSMLLDDNYNYTSEEMKQLINFFNLTKEEANFYFFHNSPRM